MRTLFALLLVLVLAGPVDAILVEGTIHYLRSLRRFFAY
jgi:hypothetical protein